MNLPSAPTILIVSGKDSTERRAAIGEQLDRAKLEHRFIDAHFPTAFTPPPTSHLPPEAIPVQGKAELGCAQSHQYAYQYVLDHDLDLAIVLEDDALLAPDFPDLIRRLRGEAFDVCLLGISKLTRHDYQNYAYYAPLYSSKQLGRWRLGRCWPRRWAGTVGYAVTREGARKLSSANTPVTVVADNWMFFGRQAGLLVKEIRPLAVFENWRDHGSLIDIERGNRQIGSMYRRDTKQRSRLFWLAKSLRGHLLLYRYRVTGR